MTRLLAPILGRDEDAGRVHTLFWGRLVSNKSDVKLELSRRLAIAASQSLLWDKKSGKPSKGRVNDIVARIANEANIYKELTAAFAHYDKKIKISGVEKVLVQQAAGLPFFEELKTQGVSATANLPFDCLTWFSIKQGAGA